MKIVFIVRENSSDVIKSLCLLLVKKFVSFNEKCGNWCNIYPINLWTHKVLQKIKSGRSLFLFEISIPHLNQFNPFQIYKY
jgi:hypothetical protein